MEYMTASRLKKSNTTNIICDCCLLNPSVLGLISAIFHLGFALPKRLQIQGCLFMGIALILIFLFYNEVQSYNFLLPLIQCEFRIRTVPANAKDFMQFLLVRLKEVGYNELLEETAV
jgi:hypothetical protein